MINKQSLQSIISKYYLNGIVESVEWKINNNTLNIGFITPTREAMGAINVPFFDMETSNMGIMNTTQFNKLISVLSGDLILTLYKEKNIQKLLISDSQFDILYTLADTILIPKVGKINEPETYNVEFNLDSEQLNALIKAKNAVGSDDKNLTIQTFSDIDEGFSLEFIFGENTDHSNKAIYSITNLPFSENINLNFDSDIFKEILSSNKDFKTSKIYIYSEGLMKLLFINEENITSEYYMVSKDDI